GVRTPGATSEGSPLDRARRSAPRPYRSVALSTIDVEDVAIDERSFVRRDENDRVGKLFREAEATHRNRRYQSRLILRRAGKAGQHAGVRGAWGHGIHPYPRLGDFERHRLGEAFDGMLAAGIDGSPRRTFVPVGRRDVDDAAAALPLHGAHFVLHAQDHAENIGVERRGIALRGLVGDRAARTFGAGIVHRDIELPEALDCAVDETADIVFAAHIGLDEFGFGTERTEFAN